MARGCHEPQPEAFNVVERVAERINFEFTAVARTCINLTNAKAAPKLGPRCASKRFGELCGMRCFGCRWRFGQDAADDVFEEEGSQSPGLKIVSSIGTVEGLVAYREVRDDVAFDSGFEQWPLEPRRVAQVTAC